MSKKKEALKLMKKQRDYLYHFYSQVCIFLNVHNMVAEERKYPTLLINMKNYTKFFNDLSKEILNTGDGADLDTLNEIGNKWKEKLPDVQEELTKFVTDKKDKKISVNSMYG